MKKCGYSVTYCKNKLLAFEYFFWFVVDDSQLSGTFCNDLHHIFMNEESSKTTSLSIRNQHLFTIAGMVGGDPVPVTPSSLTPIPGTVISLMRYIGYKYSILKPEADKYTADVMSYENMTKCGMLIPLNEALDAWEKSKAMAEQIMDSVLNSSNNCTLFEVPITISNQLFFRNHCIMAMNFEMPPLRLQNYCVYLKWKNTDIPKIIIDANNGKTFNVINVIKVGKDDFSNISTVEWDNGGLHEAWEFEYKRYKNQKYRGCATLPIPPLIKKYFRFYWFFIRPKLLQTIGCCQDEYKEFAEDGTPNATRNSPTMKIYNNFDGWFFVTTSSQENHLLHGISTKSISYAIRKWGKEIMGISNLHQNQLRSLWQTARKNAPEGVLTPNEVENFSNSMLHNVETANRYYVKISQQSKGNAGLQAFEKLKLHYETERKNQSSTSQQQNEEEPIKKTKKRCFQDLDFFDD